MLNDPVFVEASQALAKRVMKEGGSAPADRARLAFRLCTGRTPNPAELNAIVDSYQQQLAHFKGVPQAAAKLDGGDANVETAAWTMISNSLLSLDETVTKE
jgi:hypothetical protein